MATAESVQDFQKDDGLFDLDQDLVASLQQGGVVPGSEQDPDRPAFIDGQPAYDDTTMLHEKRKAVAAPTTTTAPAKKGRKPGRKPDLSEPESKRKAQNRAAQRAFRERKERHLKELEDRVMQLESEAAATSNENMYLKSQVSRLQSELRHYRNTVGLVNQTGTAVAASSPGQSPQTSSSSGSNGAPISKPFTFEFPFFGGPTPPSAQQSDKGTPSQRSSLSGTSRSGSTALSPNSSVSGASSTQHKPIKIESTDADEFCSELSQACGTRDHPLPAAASNASKSTPSRTIRAGSVPWNSLANGPQASPSNKDGQLNNNNSSSTSNNKNNNSQNQNSTGLALAGGPAASEAGSTPAGGANSADSPWALAANAGGFGDLFASPDYDSSNFVGEYRDPLFEGEEFTLPELVTSEYSMFDPIENPIANSTFDALESKSSDLFPQQSPAGLQGDAQNNNASSAAAAPAAADDDTVPAPKKGNLMNCNAVWDRICSHPKFGDIDIDGLCYELRSKAKCSDNGVLLTEKDVDKVLSNFS